jgi:DNA (cytosine-5)-methyltransferase 1
MPQPIPIIDLFAGPGGLGEGFSRWRNRDGRTAFKIRLSIEMDTWAHRTLLLRSFFRQFDPANVPASYYQYLRGEIPWDELEQRFKPQFTAAREEAWLATLGKTDPEEVSLKISSALGRDRDNWLLIGGPPCQAYSLVGRARIIGRIGRAEYEKDHRHFLYREYLRIIAHHQPAVFVMENVKGLLSAQVNGQPMFPLIRADLQDPLRVFPELRQVSRRKNLHYTLFSVVVPRDLAGDFQSSDFVVRTEDHGIPQARHRVIILGVRGDTTLQPDLLQRGRPASVRAVIGDLPPLRSRLSSKDSSEMWAAAVRAVSSLRWSDKSNGAGIDRAALERELSRIRPNLSVGGAFVPCHTKPERHERWYVDRRLSGVCNHETRGHIPEDLRRYFFSAVFASVTDPPRSPLLQDFPTSLLPDHKNVAEALKHTKFNDRFRVQLADRPSTTVVSHISKDGHYYIHYDPSQCRSLTVREAARLQTFPDNYFFEGPRTEQYHQVGNAVPPLLAHQIAKIVADIFL